MLSYAYVAIGSALGGLARFAVSGWFQRQSFPMGTLVVNVTGSFLLGALLVLFARQGDAGDAMRLLLAVGFCGGYTTFSTFSADTMGLITRGAIGLAALNVAGSVALSLGATFAGALAARRLA